MGGSIPTLERLKMTTLFIGQLHACEDNDRDLFDNVYIGQTEKEVLNKVILETAKRLIDDLNVDDTNQLQALFNCETPDGLSGWFDNHYSYFSFNIHLVTVNA